MCYCGNALVGILDTSPWSDGNLADRVVIKIFFQYFCISKKWMYNHKIEIQ